MNLETERDGRLSDSRRPPRRGRGSTRAPPPSSSSAPPAPALTAGVAGVAAGPVPAAARCRAAPHPLGVGGQLAHVAQPAVAVAPDGTVRELRDAVGHVVGGGARGDVLRYSGGGGGGHGCLAVWPEGRAQPPRPVHAAELLVVLLHRAEDIGDREGRRVLGAQRHGAAGWDATGRAEPGQALPPAPASRSRRPPAPGAGSSPVLLARRRVYARRGGAERRRAAPAPPRLPPAPGPGPLLPAIVLGPPDGS